MTEILRKMTRVLVCSMCVFALALGPSMADDDDDDDGDGRFAYADDDDDDRRSGRRGVSRVVKHCGAIRKPGVYVLARNLSTKGDCLRIRADHVTVDLAGFRIAGNGAGSGITDENAVRAGTTIRGGTITGFAVAVDLAKSPASRVTGTHIIGNTGLGDAAPLECDDTAGVFGTRAGIATASGSDVSGNIVRSNRGLAIFVGSGSRVADNVVFGNGPTSGADEMTATGICSGSGSTVTGNTMRRNTGLALQANSGSTVRGNTARQNGAGLSVNSGSTVAGNTARSNTTFGISVNCPSNVIGNTADENASDLVVNGVDCSIVDNIPAGAGG